MNHWKKIWYFRGREGWREIQVYWLFKMIHSTWGGGGKSDSPFCFWLDINNFFRYKLFIAQISLFLKPWIILSTSFWHCVTITSSPIENLLSITTSAFKKFTRSNDMNATALTNIFVGLKWKNGNDNNSNNFFHKTFTNINTHISRSLCHSHFCSD